MDRIIQRINSPAIFSIHKSVALKYFSVHKLLVLRMFFLKNLTILEGCFFGFINFAGKVIIYFGVSYFTLHLDNQQTITSRRTFFKTSFS